MPPVPHLPAFVPYPTARHLPTGARALVHKLRARGHAVLPLHRRGQDLGFIVPLPSARRMPRDAATRWRDGEAVFLPGILGHGPRRHAAAIEETLRMFDRCRRGARFLDEVERRLRDDNDLRYAGSTVDQSDPREIERVFIDAEPDGEVVATDLWAKLTWIANDQSDPSLRIRFSHGKEQIEEWMSGTDRSAGWVDILAFRMFPECMAVLRCKPLLQLLGRLLQRPYRLSERIVYNNAPDGGAVFHHDAEPGQLGVAFSQLEGQTAWLALSKRRLAELLVRRGAAKTPMQAMARLDAGDDRGLWKLLNRDAEFTGHLAARGALFALQQGDAILLPSHGIDDVAWHSVIALGQRPSLAHSYGIFPRQPDYPVAPGTTPG